MNHAIVMELIQVALFTIAFAVASKVGYSFGRSVMTGVQYWMSALSLGIIFVFIVGPTIFAMLFLINLVAWWLGRRALFKAVLEDAQSALAITSDNMREYIEYVVSLPEISVTPWVSSRWMKFSDAERSAWVDGHLQQLREFIHDQGGGDLVDEMEFYVFVQQADRMPVQPKNSIMDFSATR